MADADLSAVIGAHPLGLGAGPDRGGGDLCVALATGFASIEVGTITALAEVDHNPGAVVLASRLSLIDRGNCRIGVNIGSQFASSPSQIAANWRDAIAPLTELADFFTLNLSAPYYASLLMTENRQVVLAAISDIAVNTRQPLLVKLPFGRPDAEGSIDWLLPRLRVAGIDAIVVSSGTAQAEATRHLNQATTQSGLQVIATGGVRNSADLRARLDAGATSVQIYSVYVEDGPATTTNLVSAAIELASKYPSGVV